MNDVLSISKSTLMQNHTELNAKNVAFNIKKIREHKNYTQIYLAKRLAISQNAYSKIELGYSKITINRLFAIAQI
ncbi:helix-turn-helix protein [Pedobacter cryoconitis]|uniref:Helix-turn-helix protein n=1 Tax=Pedobacter cryoconitis TaxID=188932 RepID=A0A327S1Y9_9SPHI|nr:helix-turn-helix protein [Pedobacter cryoconitis]